MSWFEFMIPLGVALAVLMGPGALLASILGLRGLWLWAAAGPFSLSVAAIASVIAPFVMLDWGFAPIALVMVALAAVAVGLRLGFRRFAPPRHPRARSGAALLGFGVAALLFCVQLVMILGTPEAISQSYDNVFHLNATRYVLDTASASPFSVGMMTGMPFYPALWHGLVAAVVSVTGLPIPIAVNAVVFVVAGVIWPLGIMQLARTFVGPQPVVSITAGVLSAAFSGFPILLLTYGVLYPLFLGVAILPVAVAATAAVARLTRRPEPLSPLWASLVVLAALPGLALAHPGALVAWVGFTLPVVGVRFVRAMRSPTHRWFSAILFVGYLALGVAILQVLRPPRDQIYWETVQTLGQAIGEVGTASAYFRPVAFVLAALVGIGIVQAFRRRDAVSFVALGFYAVAASLYVIVSASPWDTLRYLVTGPWYNNPPRLAAILPIAMAPLAVLGARSVWAWVLLAVRRRRRMRGRGALPRTGRRLLAIVGVVLLTLGTQLNSIAQTIPEAHRIYLLADDAWLLTPDEVELLEELPDVVPDGVAVAGNPWTGASLAYAFGDRPVLVPHLLGAVSPDVELINSELRDAVPGSAVCAAVKRTGTGYVLDFGAQQVNNRTESFPGLESLDSSSAVRLVDQVGDARLFQVVGCD